MSKNDAIVKSMILDALASDMDSYLFGCGFHRMNGTITYEREVTDGVQRIEFHYDIRPAYGSNAFAHLLPQFVVVFPEVNAIFDKLVEKMPQQAGASQITFFEQFGMAVAPKDVRQVAGHWYVSSLENARKCVEQSRDFVRQWVMPFLDEYVNIKSLIDGYESHDSRLPHDRRFILIICASYIFLGRRDEALRQLEAHFGNPKLRREYAEVFSYVCHAQNTVS